MILSSCTLSTNNTLFRHILPQLLAVGESVVRTSVRWLPEICRSMLALVLIFCCYNFRCGFRSLESNIVSIQNWLDLVTGTLIIELFCLHADQRNRSRRCYSRAYIRGNPNTLRVLPPWPVASLPYDGANQLHEFTVAGRWPQSGIKIGDPYLRNVLAPSLRPHSANFLHKESRKKNNGLLTSRPSTFNRNQQ